MPELTRINFHPAYLANAEHYQRHRDWLKSTPEALAKYLVQTYLEREDEDGKQMFAERIELLDTDNSIHALLTIHHAELTKEEPTWTGMERPEAQAILQDIDGERTSAWKLLKEVFWQMLWAGFAAAETFAPPKSGERKIDALLSGERSYSRLYEPDDVVAWEYFDDDGEMRGQLKMVVFRNRICTVEKRKKNEHFQTYKVLWIDAPGDRYQTQIVRAKSELSLIHGASYVDVEPDPERGEVKQGDLQFIPVTFFGDPVEGVENTVLFQATYDARIMLNKQSHLDTTNRYNHYPRHIVSGSRTADQDSVTMSNTTLAVLEGDVRVHTLQAADPEPLRKDILRLNQSIRHKILLQPNQAVNPESRETPSVESKEADHDARGKFYSDVTDEVQHGTESLFGWAHAGFEVGIIPKGEVKATFSRDFAFTDRETEMQRLTMRRSSSSTMGKAGAMYRKRLFINDVKHTRFETIEGESEDNVREEIIKQALSQPDEDGQSELAMAFKRSQAAEERLRGGGPEGDDEDEGARGNPRDRDGDGIVGE